MTTENDELEALRALEKAARSMTAVDVSAALYSLDRIRSPWIEPAEPGPYYRADGEPALCYQHDASDEGHLSGASVVRGGLDTSDHAWAVRGGEPVRVPTLDEVDALRAEADRVYEITADRDRARADLASLDRAYRECADERDALRREVAALRAADVTGTLPPAPAWGGRRVNILGTWCFPNGQPDPGMETMDGGHDGCAVDEPHFRRDCRAPRVSPSPVKPPRLNSSTRSGHGKMARSRYFQLIKRHDDNDHEVMTQIYARDATGSVAATDEEAIGRIRELAAANREALLALLFPDLVRP